MSLFLKAKPVWVSGREQEVNCRVQFKAVCPECESARIHIATSGIYQLYINGRFVSYGPARAGKNHFRMEDIDISSFLTAEKNTVVIEVAGYYCSNFYVMQQNSFLQAEIVSGGKVIAATAEDFSARINPYYIRKIQRYSYQRAFAEAYSAINPKDSFFTDLQVGEETVITVEDKNIIKRTVDYPAFEELGATAVATGAVERVIPQEYVYDRYLTQVGFGDGQPTGWRLEELDCTLEKDWQEMRFVPHSQTAVNSIKGGHYNIYKFKYNATGMLRLKVSCERTVTLYLVFDEILSDNGVNPRRTRSCDIIRYELGAGIHSLQSFEVYTMKYVQVIALGDCTVDSLSLVEYKHPEISVPTFEDPKLQLIADAAVETYRQNAVDLFTDCPSRERAGWLCDSFFLARAEYILTGKNTVEEAFLENFLHQELYENIPAGMVPMCYPADHPTGLYIPNWAMWLIIEIRDYYKNRNGKRELVERFRDKLYGIIEFFATYENSDGLLENLDSWVFVEWSRANELVQGVNYPTNMLYYAVVKAVGELYGDSALDKKAEVIKEKINQQAYNGKFYVDRADCTANGAEPVDESTEVCQYYAFFSGVAAPQTHPQLFERLINEFGPNRDTLTVYPEIHRAAPFIGNYLRLEILKNNGYARLVAENIKEYFYYMADRTGTLWETAEIACSCNHGFASCVLYWML